MGKVWTTTGNFDAGTKHWDETATETDIINCGTGEIQLYIDGTDDDEITQLNFPGLTFVGQDAIGNVHWEGQSFLSAINFVITSISIYVISVVNTPTDLIIRLRNDAVGLPGGVLISTNPIPYGSVVVGWNKFTLTNPYECTAATIYHFTCEDVTPGSGAGSYYNIGFSNTNPYANGRREFANLGAWPPTPWIASVGTDLTFKIHSQDYVTNGYWLSDEFDPTDGVLTSGVESIDIVMNCDWLRTSKFFVLVDDVVVATSNTYAAGPLVTITEGTLQSGTFADTMGERHCKIKVYFISDGSWRTPEVQSITINNGVPIVPTAPHFPAAASRASMPTRFKNRKHGQLFGLTPKVNIWIEKSGVDIPIAISDFDVTFERNSIIFFTVKIPNNIIAENKDKVRDLVDFNVKITVEIFWISGILPLKFHGYIYSVTSQISNSGDVIVVNCSGELRELVEAYTVDYSSVPWEIWEESKYYEFFHFQGMSIAQHLIEILDDRMGYTVGYNSDSTSRIDNPGEWYFRLGFAKEKILDACRRVADYAQYLFFWDYDREELIIQPDDKFTFDHDNVYSNYILGERSYFSNMPFYNSISGFTIPTFSINSLSLEFSKEYIFNDDEVPCVNDSQTHIDVNSMTTYGHKNKIFDDSTDITTNQCVLNEITAQAIAINKIRENKTKKFEISFTTIGHNTVKLGDTIYVNAKNNYIDENAYNFWKVLKIKHKYNRRSGWITTIIAKTYTDVN